MIQLIPAIRYVRSTTAENAIPGPKCTATTQCQDTYLLERERDNEGHFSAFAQLLAPREWFRVPALYFTQNEQDQHGNMMSLSNI